MRVSILGCGWFGTALAKSLTGRGLPVKGSTTSAINLDDTRTHLVKLNSAADSAFDPEFFDCDLLVVANNVRMNDEAAYLTRVPYTIALIQKFHIPKVIFVSSISVYGEPNAIVDEATPPRPETPSAKLLFKAEQLFQSAPFPCSILRLGGLVGPGRDPGKFFTGKTNVPNGLAPVNLIHLDDAVAICAWLIESGSAIQIINGVFPEHPTRMDFYTAAARRSGLPPPAFVAERTQWKIVAGIYPEYSYKYNLLS